MQIIQPLSLFIADENNLGWSYLEKRKVSENHQGHKEGLVTYGRLQSWLPLTRLPFHLHEH